MLARDHFDQLFHKEDAVARVFLEAIQRDLLASLRQTLRPLRAARRERAAGVTGGRTPPRKGVAAGGVLRHRRGSQQSPPGWRAEGEERMSLELVVSRRRRTAARARWLRRAGVLAVVMLVCTPFVAAAKPRHDTTPARSSAAAAGAVYGGVTPQEYGLMVEVNRSGRRIVRMATGLALDCTSGKDIATPDGWTKIPVSKSGKFSERFGP